MSLISFIKDVIRREFALAVPVIGVAVAAVAAKHNIVIDHLEIEAAVAAVVLGFLTRLGVSPAAKPGL